jgi:LytS/YehU family sensor histidine kinase
VLSAGLRLAYRALMSRPVWLQLSGLLLGSAAAGYVWLQARSSIYSHWFEKGKEMEDWMEKLGDMAELYQKVSYMETFVSAWVVMLAWSVLYFAIKYYQLFQEVQKSALKSAAMAHEAQLKMLRYQLNPHFLFNTLNAISTLVLERETESANRMVTRLSSFLRHSLDNDPMQKVTLEQELTALKLYLDIEKVRFEERLTLDLDIGGEAAHALIPSLLLQPLVENAIKYGIARSEEGGHLRIAARVFAGDLLIELSDDGPGVELVDGQIPDASGVGLRNTRERLAELYGSRHSFTLSPTDPHGLTINIRIPFERGEP